MTRESTERRRATAAARTHAVSEEPRFESIRAFHEHAFDTMSGKRSASEAPADEPDAKAAKVEEEPKPEDADAEPADQDMAEEEGDKGDAAPARRSTRTRNPVRKARIEGKTSKGVEAKIAQVQYKEGELLSDHLKSEGTLVEVKIPAECTVSTNLQVSPAGIPRARRVARFPSLPRRTRRAPSTRARSSPVPLPDAPTPIPRFLVIFLLLFPIGARSKRKTRPPSPPRLTLPLPPRPLSVPSTGPHASALGHGRVHQRLGSGGRSDAHRSLPPLHDHPPVPPRGARRGQGGSP